MLKLIINNKLWSDLGNSSYIHWYILADQNNNYPDLGASFSTRIIPGYNGKFLLTYIFFPASFILLVVCILAFVAFLIQMPFSIFCQYNWYSDLSLEEIKHSTLLKRWQLTSLSTLVFWQCSLNMVSKNLHFKLKSGVVRYGILQCCGHKIHYVFVALLRRCQKHSHIVRNLNFSA